MGLRGGIACMYVCLGDGGCSKVEDETAGLGG